ncbi:hypothetical protein C1X64_37600, partial [Pseudomonas sp. GW456-E7]
PVRVELFDTEVDSIRSFNSDDQRSIETLTSINIGPAKELIIRPEEKARAMEKIDKGLAASLKKLKVDKQKEILHANISHDKERLSEG